MNSNKTLKKSKDIKLHSQLRELPEGSIGHQCQTNGAVCFRTKFTEFNFTLANFQELWLLSISTGPSVEGEVVTILYQRLKKSF